MGLGLGLGLITAVAAGEVEACEPVRQRRDECRDGQHAAVPQLVVREVQRGQG